MPQELPGFYFDPEKNRYFPIKGPIPGTYRKKNPVPEKPISLTTKERSPLQKDLSKLLYYRELYGSSINVRGRNRNFEEEYKQKLISKPKVWRYQDVDRHAIRSLSLVNINVETPEGQCSTDALLTAGINGSLSLFDVGFVGDDLRLSLKATADSIWPENSEPDSREMVNDIWKFGGATFVLPSSISGISMPRKVPLHEDTDNAAVKHALITTLGSESSGGALYVFNLADPVDSYSSILSVGRLRELASLNCTIWGADVNCSGSKAIVGTNLGATLVDVQSGVSSVLCRSKSDVLSVQLIHSDNIALCGLRNGAIVSLDVRQPQRMMARHRLANPYHDSTSNRTLQKSNKKPCCVLRGNIQPSSIVYMPSSICCLESLQTYDQYFLASSMDGSMRLYDHRLTSRGPVQSYEGHVNSHSPIKFAIDATERFVMSGGEDCKMRIWSIKSGELLFEEKLSSSIPLTSCWQRSGGFSNASDETQNLEDCRYRQTRNCDAWVGTAEGILRMRFPE